MVCGVLQEIFIKDFSKIARPLNNLIPSTIRSKTTKKKKTMTPDWEWNAYHLLLFYHTLILTYHSKCILMQALWDWVLCYTRIGME